METTLEEMAQPVHISEMKELFSRLGINLLSQFGELPRFTALAEAKKEEVAKAGRRQKTGRMACPLKERKPPFPSILKERLLSLKQKA